MKYLKSADAESQANINKHTIWWTHVQKGKVVFGANEIIRNIMQGLVWLYMLWSLKEYMTLYLCI